MSGKLYRLALWYIGKCNAKWENKNLLRKEVEKLDRLTYKNFGKYVLFYGGDAEWQKFSRYDVLDNAIQKLAKYENAEEKNRGELIDDFVSFMESWAEQIEGIRRGTAFFTMENIRDAADQMRGGKVNDI